MMVRPVSAMEDMKAQVTPVCFVDGVSGARDAIAEALADVDEGAEFLVVFRAEVEDCAMSVCCTGVYLGDETLEALERIRRALLDDVVAFARSGCGELM